MGTHYICSCEELPVQPSIQNCYYCKPFPPLTNKAVHCDSWKMDHSADVAAMAIVVEQEEEEAANIK